MNRFCCYQMQWWVLEGFCRLVAGTLFKHAKPEYTKCPFCGKAK